MVSGINSTERGQQTSFRGLYMCISLIPISSVSTIIQIIQNMTEHSKIYSHFIYITLKIGVNLTDSRCLFIPFNIVGNPDNPIKGDSYDTLVLSKDGEHIQISNEVGIFLSIDRTLASYVQGVSSDLIG